MFDKRDSKFPCLPSITEIIPIAVKKYKPFVSVSWHWTWEKVVYMNAICMHICMCTYRSWMTVIYCMLLTRSNGLWHFIQLVGCHQTLLRLPIESSQDFRDLPRSDSNQHSFWPLSPWIIIMFILWPKLKVRRQFLGDWTEMLLIYWCSCFCNWQDLNRNVTCLHYPTQQQGRTQAIRLDMSSSVHAYWSTQQIQVGRLDGTSNISLLFGHKRQARFCWHDQQVILTTLQRKLRVCKS